MSSLDDDWAAAKSEAAPLPKADLERDWKAAKTEPAPEKPEEPPLLSPKSTSGGALRGAVQGGTLGFGDEVQGAVGTYKEMTDRLRNVLMGKPAVDPEENIFGAPSLGDTYRAERNAARRENATAEKASPAAYNAADVAASFAVPLPGPGKATGLARLGKFALNGAVAGGASALGNSDADVTQGQLGDAVKDVGAGAALGAPLGVAGGAVGDRIAARGAAAQQTARDAAQKLAEKTFNSARGALGGEVSSGARTLEVLEKAASDPSLPEEVSRSAVDFLAGPEAAALRAQVARSSVARGSDQLGRISNARDAMAEAGQALSPSAVEAAAVERLSPAAAGKAIKSRASTIAQRFGPAIVGSTLGAQFGGTKGALLGALMGTGVGAGLGKPGTIIANMLNDPAVAYNLSRVSAPVVSGTTSALEQAGGRAQQTVRDKLSPYLELLEQQRDGGQ